MGQESTAAYNQAQDCALADAVEYGSPWQATPTLCELGARRPQVAVAKG
ncbi:hypothetical protein [Streptomyces sp. AS02]|nr:hypothetical protein [Streptomyces sp. AS02]MCL8016369.1 hypothetical protein [Streptomyces sp. AS02]